MPLPSFRSSRSKVRRRRSHHALKAINTTSCPKCAATILSHRACKKCGFYNGRAVTAGMDDVKKAIAKTAKKVSKKAAAPEAEASHEGHNHAPGVKHE